MKRRLLYLAFALITVLGFSNHASALNAYAYDLAASYGEGTSKITVNYALNDVAESAAITFFTSDSQKHNVDLTGDLLTKGSHSIEVDASAFAAGNASWSISVTSAKVDVPTAQTPAYQFYHPQGVAVDNNFESPYFGRILVTECMTVTSATYQSGNAADGKGIYAFDPQLNPIPNKTGTFAFKGGLTYEESLSTTGTAYDPRKIRIAEDGRIFLTRQAGLASSLWEVNAADLNADFTEIFKGTVDPETYELKTTDGAIISRANVGFDVKGAGENLQLLLLQTNKSGIGYSYSGFSVDEYNLGTATSWDKIPTKNIDWLTGQWTIQANNTNVVYDNEGGIWYVQYRATPSDEQPSILHINAKGEEDYRNIEIVAGGAGIRFNKDFTLLAVANAKKQVGVYAVGKDETGKPTLTLKFEFATTIGTNCNDIAWDIADNLYIVGNSGEWFKTFALPRDVATAVTQASSKQGLVIPEPKPVSPYTLTEVKTIKEGLPAVAEARQAAFANGKLYIQNKADKQVEVWTAEGKTAETFASGEGTNIASDEAGNIIVRIGAFPNKFANGTAELRILPADGSAAVDVTLDGLPEGRCDFFGKVRGNVLDATTGGTLYIAPTGLVGVVVIPIIAGKQDVDNTFTMPLTAVTAADGGTVVYPYGETDLIYNRRTAGNSIRKIVVEGETGDDSYIFNTPEHYAANGCSVFTMGGVEYMLYPTSTSSAYKDGFAIALATNAEENPILVKHDETFAAASNSFQSNWLFAEVISDTQANIYQYCPGGMIAKYVFTAPAPVVVEKPLYIIGQVAGNTEWAANVGAKMTETETAGIYTITTTINGAFGFATKLAAGNNAADWDVLNANRYGCAVDGELLKNKVSAKLEKAVGAFNIKAGEYLVTVDMNAMTILCESTAPEVPAVYTLVELRKMTEGLPVVADARQATLANGKLYIQNKADKKIEVWSHNGKLEESYESGEGTNITSDEAGNIIVRIGAFPNKFANGTAELRIIPADGTTPVDVTLEGLPEGRCDFFGKVRGNVLDATTGGKLYIAPTGLVGVVVVPIIAGKQDVDNTFTMPLTNVTAADGGTVVYPYGENDLIYNRRTVGNSIRKIVVDGETGDDSYIFNTPEHNASNGSVIFTMGGVEYILYPTTASASYKDGFAIALATNAEENPILVKHEETLTAASNSFQSNWLFAQVVSDTRALIYQYCPGGFIAAYEFNTVDNVYPTEIYAIGNLNSTAGDWKTNDASNALKPVEGVNLGEYSALITVAKASDNANGFVALSTVLGATDADWTTFNTGRIGATSQNQLLKEGVVAPFVLGNDFSFMLVPDTYTLSIDYAFGEILAKKYVGVSKPSVTATAKVIGGVGEINVIGENIQSIEVYTIGGALISTNEANIQCVAGIYLVRVDGQVTKVIVR
ncbi:MAG: hypothetical protein PHR45_02555 [Muribaculaceae bacterium]|nr:hypothetical protein [Muribaculaceae bacterium]